VPERAPECPNCGATPPRRARFCPECGTRLEAGDSPADTAVLEAPLTETGPVPVDVSAAEPRWFGVTPPMLVFALAVAALAVAALLLATGHLLPGLLSLAAALLLFVAFAEVVQRKPEGAAARISAGTIGAARARAGYAVDAIATRSRAAREIGRVRRELLGFGGTRERLLRELGESVYRDDRKGTKRLRAELAELDVQIESKEGEMATIAAEARERMQRARLQVQPTELVEVPEPPRPSPDPSPIPAPDPGPPTPAPVPEPSPTPVPEPYPPPDEATPPEPAQVPEPGPLGRKRKKK
jgi:uncharacterized protein YdcH (DUF465 family)